MDCAATLTRESSFSSFESFISMREEFMRDFTRNLSSYSDNTDAIIRPTPNRITDNNENVLQPNKQRQCMGCNCKKSGCLKMYCECFKKGILCEGCSCINCQNQFYNKANIDVLRSQLNKSNSENDAKLAKGCTCKKSGCQKGYCDCFNFGQSCSENCRCENCLNK